MTSLVISQNLLVISRKAKSLVNAKMNIAFTCSISAAAARWLTSKALTPLAGGAGRPPKHK